LEAIGNTSVEGGNDTFRATAATIRYSSEKGQLTLEGDGRRDVEFWQRPLNGQDKRGAARRMEYTPEKRHLRLIEAKSGSALAPAR
jgi:lipopolysaccharide export system protein LptA